jgi:hypothetical protein
VINSKRKVTGILSRISKQSSLFRLIITWLSTSVKFAGVERRKAFRVEISDSSIVPVIYRRTRTAV